jgi:hypothetical protein
MPQLKPSSNLSRSARSLQFLGISMTLYVSKVTTKNTQLKCVAKITTD